jgi:hypothetical protein
LPIEVGVEHRDDFRAAGFQIAEHLEAAVPREVQPPLGPPGRPREEALDPPPVA